VTATTIVVMILVLGFVWGGLALIIATASRKERGKTGGGTLEP
jgi:succinate-acetate transporter protein